MWQTHTIALWWWPTPTFNVSHFSFTTSFIPNLSRSRPACFPAPSITIIITYPTAHPRHRWLASCRPCDLCRDARTGLAAAGFRPPLLRYVYIYIYLYTIRLTWTHTYTDTYIHTRTYVHRYIHTHTHTHIHIESHRHIQIQTHTSTYMYKYILHIHTYTHMYIYTHIYINNHKQLHTCI